MRGLADNKQEAIRALREYGYSQSKTSEILDVSRNSVKKYEPDHVDGHDDGLKLEIPKIQEALDGVVDPADVCVEEFVPEGPLVEDDGGYTDNPVQETPLRSAEEKNLRFKDDYSDLSPGDFISMFFNEFEVGIKSKFVRMQSRRASRRGELPNEEKMLADLKDMASGVKNDTEARYIAEEYWAEAETYLAETDYQATEWGNESSGDSAGGGDFVGPNNGDDGDGQWLQVPGQGMMYGKMVQGPNGQQVFQPMQPPGQMGQQMGMMGGGGFAQQQNNNAEVEAIREEMRSLREEMSSKSDNGIADELQRFKTIKGMMEELTDDKKQAGASDEVKVLQQELQRLRQEMTQSSQNVEPENPQEAMFKRLMSDESVSTEKLLQYADKLEGNTDPEIRQKEIERDLEMEKMKQKRERTENIVNSLGDVVDRFGESLGRAIAGSGGGGGGGQQQQTQAQPQQGQQGQQQGQQQQSEAIDQRATADGTGIAEQQTPQMQEWECDHCGEEQFVDPSGPGVECGNCDYSIMPCPDCSHPVEVPPADEVDRAACPDCDNPVMLPDDMDENAACLSCDWAGPAEEAAGDGVECGSCGETHYPQTSQGGV